MFLKAVLLIIGLANVAVIAQTVTCSGYSTYYDGTTCNPYCGNDTCGAVSNSNGPCNMKPGCYCNAGYRRDPASKLCIPEHNCPNSNGKCGTHATYYSGVPNSSCAPHCGRDDCSTKPIQTQMCTLFNNCLSGCYCDVNNGYNRINTTYTCVPQNLCPK